MIGAGIIGMAIANYLQRDGHDVFVIDPNEPGRGTSWQRRGFRNIVSRTDVDARRHSPSAEMAN